MCHAWYHVNYMTCISCARIRVALPYIFIKVTAGIDINMNIVKIMHAWAIKTKRNERNERNVSRDKSHTWGNLSVGNSQRGPSLLVVLFPRHMQQIRGTKKTKLWPKHDDSSTGREIYAALGLYTAFELYAPFGLYAALGLYVYAPFEQIMALYIEDTHQYFSRAKYENTLLSSLAVLCGAMKRSAGALGQKHKTHTWPEITREKAPPAWFNTRQRKQLRQLRRQTRFACRGDCTTTLREAYYWKTREKNCARERARPHVRP